MRRNTSSSLSKKSIRRRSDRWKTKGRVGDRDSEILAIGTNLKTRLNNEGEGPTVVNYNQEEQGSHDAASLEVRMTRVVGVMPGQLLPGYNT